MNSLLIKYSNTFLSIDLKARYITIARMILAFGTLCTLTFDNPASDFKIYGDISQIYTSLSLTKISIFYLLQNNLFAAKIISIIILLSVISGFYPRYTCFLHWWVSYSYLYSTFFFDGGDQITAILTLLLIPICITDSRKNQWKTNSKKFESSSRISVFFKYNAVFSLLLIQLQVAILYLNASIGKLAVKEWLNGTVLYYWFTDHDFGMPNYLQPFLLPIIKNPILLPILTWSVLLFEFLLFMCLVFPKLIKKKFMYAGILFHGMIFLIHGLFSFFIAMSAALILYLSPVVRKNINNEPI